jgi:hypothetical protein
VIMAEPAASPSDVREAGRYCGLQASGVGAGTILGNWNRVAAPLRAAGQDGDIPDSEIFRKAVGTEVEILMTTSSARRSALAAKRIKTGQNEYHENEAAR